MRLDTILQNIQSAQSASEKVASERTIAPAPVTRDALAASLNAAMAGEKVASVQATRAPVDDLMKIASEVAATEQEMAVKEAQLLGRAFADAVVSRVGEWQSAATKVAADYSVGAEDGLDKFASENPDLIKEAAAQGYAETKAALEKIAAESFDQGYNDMMTEVHEKAAAEFLKAAAVTNNVLQAIAAQQG
jgi:hypothetical protein